ncbi:uncharacterized protein EI97DRAFT_503558 [Westerdykella ornata]|uniref:Uncharacterized protein n=1 Tax=Westerdykella ornata TaxID=318751 RepID=A0A6A6JAL5_WESOR|nr:uncharacterized protein EI97DRAFT_503558 [Westerdykella ornata]KAF2273274.1 hypothetical protein EI97DRAFT_503558 [Westerdykella ornata]
MAGASPRRHPWGAAVSRRAPCITAAATPGGVPPGRPRNHSASELHVRLTKTRIGDRYHFGTLSVRSSAATKSSVSITKPPSAFFANMTAISSLEVRLWSDYEAVQRGLYSFERVPGVLDKV